MKATAIPERSRALVKSRDRFRCARCFMPAPAGHWHHRRSRSVPGEHQHCPCNGVWLCATCHSWAHQNPNAAQRFGFIVSRSVDEPASVPVLTPTGWIVLDCGGGWRAST